MHKRFEYKYSSDNCRKHPVNEFWIGSGSFLSEGKIQGIKSLRTRGKGVGVRTSHMGLQASMDGFPELAYHTCGDPTRPSIHHRKATPLPTFNLTRSTLRGSRKETFRLGPHHFLFSENLSLRIQENTKMVIQGCSLNDLEFINCKYDRKVYNISRYKKLLSLDYVQIVF